MNDMQKLGVFLLLIGVVLKWVHIWRLNCEIKRLKEELSSKNGSWLQGWSAGVDSLHLALTAQIEILQLDNARLREELSWRDPATGDTIDLNVDALRIRERG